MDASIHIAICDDSAVYRQYLTGLLHEWGRMHEQTCQISEFSTAEEFLFAWEDHQDVDIFLLDIEMPGMNGVELARNIRQRNTQAQIVFITGYAEYMAIGYDVEALHYLLKPVDSEKLFAVLDRAVTRLQRQEPTLLIEQHGVLTRVPVSQIRYIEVNRNYVTIHVDTAYQIRRSMKEIETLLDKRFLRIGRSYIVNLTYIQQVSKTELTLIDGTKLYLPRGSYNTVNRAIIDLD